MLLMSYMWFQRGIRLASIPALIVCLFAQMASAQGLLRDADIEHGLKQLAAPLLSAAGLSPKRVKILVVNDSSLNAFVVSNNAIFIHYGLIVRMNDAAMLQGVIAHEAAHIANGHIARRAQNFASARTAAGFGMALAAIAGAAGVPGEAATGLAIGTQSSALRRFLKHTRAEEASADQSAVRYMRAAGINPRGMSDVLTLFRGQELMAESRQDPYTRTHPFSRDRVRALDGYVASFGRTLTDTSLYDYWFSRVKGKLSAYKRAPGWTMQRVSTEPYSDVRLLRTAVAQHRSSNTDAALRAIDAAIAQRPDDPFLHDQRGQILLESRNFQAAVSAYAKAAELAPNDSLILSGYGRALLIDDQTQKARDVLEEARTIDFRDASMLRDLSVAYARLDQNGMASLVTAERYAVAGRLDDAAIHAKRASGLLDVGSGAWQRAQDVLTAAERAAKRR